MHRILGTSASGGEPFGTSLLFFGCRCREQDYLYGSLLEHWADHGLLRLFTAFSREQARSLISLGLRLSDRDDSRKGLVRVEHRAYHGLLHLFTAFLRKQVRKSRA